MTVLILNYNNAIRTKYTFFAGDSDFENRVIVESNFKPGNHANKEMVVTFKCEGITTFF